MREWNIIQTGTEFKYNSDRITETLLFVCINRRGQCLNMNDKVTHLVPGKSGLKNSWVMLNAYHETEIIVQMPITEHEYML